MLVLVLADDWGSPSAATLDGIRAELRELGAALLVLDRESLFYFRPTEDAHSSASPPELSPQLLAELAQSYGLTHAPSSASHSTLSVLDEQGELRLHITRYLEDDVAETLLTALRLAGQRLQQSASQALFARRELAVYSLVGALTRVLSECFSKQQHETKQVPAYLSSIRAIQRARGRVSA